MGHCLFAPSDGAECVLKNIGYQTHSWDGTECCVGPIRNRYRWVAPRGEAATPTRGIWC